MLRRTLTAIALTLPLALVAAPVLAQSAPAPSMTAPADAEDPYLWLEEVEGERALAWVEEQNTRSLGVLTGDPRYQDLHDQALTLLEARDRIPSPGFRRLGGVEQIDNFWQDATHVRGLWRKTT
ncbi:MAG: S9 family peptidase, partial [Brevundimonas sp.]|nr:S9 family peptidase [Brevundimonas sp.]